MNELKRQAYLEAMGFQVVYPRIALPGARQSPHYELSAASPVEVVRKAIPAPIETAPSVASVPPPTVNATSTEDYQAATDALPQSAAETSEAATDTLKFSLRYYRINEQFAVIDELPHAQSGNGSEDRLSLLRNILLALNIDTDTCNFAYEPFDWPLMEGLPVETEPSLAARQALGGFIAMRKRLDGFGNLLVFAGQIDALLLRPTKKAEQKDTLVKVEDYHLTVTSSLQAMLSFPMLKKEAWEQLQPLRQRLHITAAEASPSDSS
ncbi:MAG: hypothetical protein QGF90_19295 [Gammaproteobacteria bacterium]|nr:hypothetical protein [Gammaproteobacteria bacterium]